MPKKRRKIRFEKTEEEEAGRNIPLSEFVVKEKMKVKLVERKEPEPVVLKESKPEPKKKRGILIDGTYISIVL